ncbi:MAG: helix-turn-helix transcriptional regulator [Ktedonobacterales bacterium]
MAESNDLPKKTLKEWRKERGMTQLELATKIGVTPPTIWNIENGRNRPTFDNVMAIAEILGVQIDQIIWPEYKPYPSRENRTKKDAPEAA